MISANRSGDQNEIDYKSNIDINKLRRNRNVTSKNLQDKNDKENNYIDAKIK